MVNGIQNSKLKNQNLSLLLAVLLLASLLFTALFTCAAPASPPTALAATSAVQSTPPSDIPTSLDRLSFALPPGNGYGPQKLALDPAARRLFTLNAGQAGTDNGNTLSVISLDAAQVADLLPLHNRDPNAPFLPDPLALQFDPLHSQLYVTVGDRYGKASETSLVVIDADSLTLLHTLPGVDAVAAGPDRLFLVSDGRLWTADPDTLEELNAVSLTPRNYNDNLLFNPEANRLYLRRGPPWSLEIFEADTLMPVSSYLADDELLQVALDATNDHLLILETAPEQTTLRTLDANGRPLSIPPPVALSPDLSYSSLPLILTGDSLYVLDREPDNYQTYSLRRFSLPELHPQDILTLNRQPDDLLADPETGLLYAAYSYPNGYIQAINPETGQTFPIFTAVVITEALADPDAGQLYVLTSDGLLHILDGKDYTELAQLDTGLSNTASNNSLSPRLSLDSRRHRLYLSGSPVQVVNLQTGQVTPYPGVSGQITPDPNTNHLFLTPPCRCRMSQCNTFIVHADTLTGTETLFPPAPPLTAECVVRTHLDSRSRLLYAHIYNGVPGSNSGNYLAAFDVSTTPRRLEMPQAISYGRPAIDPSRARAFAARYRLNRTYIERFERRGQTITPTLTLAGAGGELVYDPTFDRLYAVGNQSIQVFNGSLTLLADAPLPSDLSLQTFDPLRRRLYLSDNNGGLHIFAASGGQPAPPEPPSPARANVPQLRVAPNGDMFRFAGRGLFRSTDGGNTWAQIGAGLPARNITAVEVSPAYPDDGLVLVGLNEYGRLGGLFRSTDRGQSWLPATRGLTDLEIEQVVFSPTFARDQTIFATTSAHGLFRSTDGGDTWRSLAHTYTTRGWEDDLHTGQVAVSPTFATDGLVLMSYRGLLHRSPDRGQHWENLALPGSFIVFSPTFAQDGLVLVDARWRSEDRGQTFQPAAAGLDAAGEAVNIFFSPRFAANQTAYALLRVDYETIRLYRSVNGGQRWQSLLAGLPDDFSLAWATVLPDGRLYLTGADGTALTIEPDELHWGQPPVDINRIDIQALAVQPDGTLLVANSTVGVLQSTNGGQSWQDTGFPARGRLIDEARMATANDGTVFVSPGVGLLRGRGSSWELLTGLPSGLYPTALAVSPNFSRDGTVLVGGDYRLNQLYRTTDGGQTWQTVFDGGKVEGGSDIRAIAFAPDFARSGLAFAWLENGGLLRSEDGGQTWMLAVDETVQHYSVQSLAVAPDGRLFAGALDGYVLISVDRGNKWTAVREKIPGQRMWSSTLAFIGKTVLLGTDVGVFRSPDGGITWQEASTGLPVDESRGTLQSVRTLAVSGGQIYAGLTAGGVYVSEDRGQSWRPAGTASTAPVSETTATPAATECSSPPTYFAGLWEANRARLGCPLAAMQTVMAGQTFEHGRMFWRGDAAVIYVFAGGQPLGRFADIWDESQPAYSCPEAGPSETPPTPQRGFGKVWCAEPAVRQRLGNAIEPEQAFEALVQEFERGVIFGPPGGEAFVFVAP